MDLSVIPNTVNYPAIQIAQAACAYVMLGACTRVAEVIGIPERTINDWTHTEWWPALIDQARAAKQDEIDAGLQEVLDQGIKQTLDRLKDGDYVYVQGDLKRKPVSARDAAIVTAVAFDKQRILRNLPTSISSSGGESKLSAMAERLKKIELQQQARIVNEQ